MEYSSASGEQLSRVRLDNRPDASEANIGGQKVHVHTEELLLCTHATEAAASTNALDVANETTRLASIHASPQPWDPGKACVTIDRSFWQDTWLCE